MMKTLLGAGVWWHTILKQWNDQHMDDTQLAVWTTFAVVQGLIFIASITLPDVMMILVARIYFTECYLYAKSFVNEVTDMNMDEIIDGHILERYLEMNKKIEGYSKLFYLWIMNVLLQLLMSSWHAVSIYLHPYDQQEFYLIYQSLEALIYVLATMFVLWPAMLMTEKINSLKEVVNDKLDHILKSRLHFHDDLILNNLMNAIIQKQHEYMADDVSIMQDPMDEQKDLNVLYESMVSHSKQECALEILNRIKYYFKKHSCCYELIGVEIDRNSIRDFVIALVVTNILSFMWDNFGSAT